MSARIPAVIAKRVVLNENNYNGIRVFFDIDIQTEGLELA